VSESFPDINIEIIEQKEMPDAQLDRVLSILAGWFLQDPDVNVINNDRALEKKPTPKRRARIADK
jgi:hypothetical protein